MLLFKSTLAVAFGNNTTYEAFIPSVTFIFAEASSVTANSNAPLLYSTVSSYNVPIFAGEEGTCKGCGYATLAISYYNLGVATGEMAAEILLEGANISEMPIRYDANPVKKYNPVICEEMGIDVDALIADGYVAIELD